MKKVLNFIKNPFYRVAGYTALVWGVAGIIVSTAIACGGGIHFHGCCTMAVRPTKRGGVLS